MEKWVQLRDHDEIQGEHRRRCEDNINPLNAELNPMCCLLALLGAHHFLHVRKIRVKRIFNKLNRRV
jgi:hypothetical protein